MEWGEHRERQASRYADGLARLPDDADARQRQLTRVANAALGAGFAELMAGQRDEAERWLLEAASRYRESYIGAPPDSWGRMIGAVKLRVVAGDWDGAAEDARWTLECGAAAAVSPIGRYAASVAELVLDSDDAAAVLAEGLVAQQGEGFPVDVADAIAAIATRDESRYAQAFESVVRSFETREEYLEDVPIADTALMLAALAGRRAIASDATSELLPGDVA